MSAMSFPSSGSSAARSRAAPWVSKGIREGRRPLAARSSRSSSFDLVVSPPNAEKPPAPPLAASTRWQGTMTASGLRPSACPMARCEPGAFIVSARPPYVVVVPDGTPSAARYTRAWNGGTLSRSSSTPAKSSAVPDRWRVTRSMASRIAAVGSVSSASASRARIACSFFSGRISRATPRSLQAIATCPRSVSNSA